MKYLEKNYQLFNQEVLLVTIILFISRGFEMSEESSLTLDKIITESFVKEYTDFDSVADFVRASGLTEVDTHGLSDDEYDDLKDEILDDFIIENSQFESWDEMVAKAAQIYLFGG